MWAFCMHSLFREYGWQFIRLVALPHPLKTARAVLDSCRIDFSGSVVSVPAQGAGQFSGGPGSVMGLGFCMKPMLCPSGRFNHECQYLEGLPQPVMHEGCRACAIRSLGLLALKSSSALYIMTSAQDILLDLFAPSLKDGRFSSGLFLLCRYSLQPFAVGLLAGSVSGLMVPFDGGDCRDYPTWLLADTGTKNEQTCLDTQTLKAVCALLAQAKKENAPTRFVREGEIFFPAGPDV